MQYPLVIPTYKATRFKPPAGGGFWDKYWEKYDEKNEYQTKINYIKASIPSVYKGIEDSKKKIYVDVVLNKGANSKTNKPKKLWLNSGLDIVASKENNRITLSGRKESYQKLEEALSESSFEIAKAGKGNSGLLSREAHAIDSIDLADKDYSSRISKDLFNELQVNPSDWFECIVEVYSDQKISDYSDIVAKIRSILGNEFVQERDERLFITNMSCKARLNSAYVKKLLTDSTFNFISKIRLTKQFSTQRFIPSLDTKSLQLGELLTNETIAVFDSGVHHPLMDPIVSQRYNYIGKKDQNNDHGTFVTSRILFGSNIFDQVIKNGSKLSPVGKILDVMVTFKDPKNPERTIPDEDELLKAFIDISNRHKDIKIFNICINETRQAKDSAIDELTQLLDSVSRENDLIIVCSAGNNTCYPSSTNNKDLFNHPSLDTGIASPADGLNVISVGSICDSSNEESYSKEKNHPSPFTRKGGTHRNWKKPEFVQYGGNVALDPDGIYGPDFMRASNNKFGVEGINTLGLHKDVGTSFSAPLVTRQCALLLDFLKSSSLARQEALKGHMANLVKALMVHSTSRNEQAKIEDKEVSSAYGFGIPNHESMISDNENQITSIYFDRIGINEKKHSLPINLPSSMIGHNIDIVFTLVYNPPVNKNHKIYKTLSLRPSLRFIFPQQGEDTNDPKSILQKHSWDVFRSPDFNTCHFRRNIKKLKHLNLEVLLQMMLSESFDEASFKDDFSQSYAIVVTITDLDAQGTLRKEMLETKQFEEVIEQDVQIEAQIS